MNLYEYAKSEMDRAWPGKEDRMQEAVKDNVLELVKVFSRQFHSGFSGAYVLSVLDRILHWKPITPVTGEEDEWQEPWGDDNHQQNKRCSSVFRKNFDNSTAYDIDRKVFSTDGGETFFSNKDSKMPVTFPYFPPVHPERIILEKSEEDEG